MTSAKEHCEDAAVVAVLSELDNVFKLPLQPGLHNIGNINTHGTVFFGAGAFRGFFF